MHLLHVKLAIFVVAFCIFSTESRRNKRDLFGDEHEFQDGLGFNLDQLVPHLPSEEFPDQHGNGHGHGGYDEAERELEGDVGGDIGDDHEVKEGDFGGDIGEDPVLVLDSDSGDTEVIDPTTGFTKFFTGFSSFKPWYKGPHTCLTVEKIDETDHVNETSGASGTFSISGGIFSSSLHNVQVHSAVCSETLDEYTCTIQEIVNGMKSTRIEKRRCCYGYKRQDPNGSCKKVDLKDMVETLKNVGGEEFYNLTVSVGMEDVLKDNNLTIFCPSNDAMDEINEATNQVDIATIPLSRRRRQATDGMAYLIKNHMVTGFVRAGDFKDEGIVATMNGKTKLRTNIYRVPQTIMTVNCARITSINNFATNGIVHMVDRMVKPVTDTVGDIITRKSEFSTLKRLISATGLLPLLGDAESHVTLFAPTDEAFKKSGVDLEKLESAGCLEALLKNHILNNVVCSSAINGQVRARNLLRKKLKLKRDSSDQKLYVGDDNVQIIAKDLVATNGVVHIIDGVDVPVESTQLLEVLSDYGYSAITDAIKKTKLEDVLQNTGNSTFLVPQKQAFQNLPDEIKNDTDKLSDLLLYHFIAPTKSVVANNEKMEARNGKLIRFNRYNVGYGGGIVTAQCVPIRSPSGNVCGGEIQTINGVMKPASGTLLEIMDKKYVKMYEIIKTANMTHLLSGDKSYTLFVPTDDALEKSLSKDELKSVTEEEEEAKKFVRRHILPEFLCCAGIGGDIFGFFHNSKMALDGSHLTVKRDSLTNTPKIDGANIKSCDIIAENGVVHEIDRVIGGRRRRNPFFCIFNC